MSASRPRQQGLPILVRVPGRRPAQIPAFFATHRSLQRQLTNWLEVERQLFRELPSFPLRHSFYESAYRPFDGESVQLEFRNGRRVPCTSPSQLALLLYSVYAAETLLGPQEVAAAVQSLQRISSYVLDQLTSNYRPTDIASGALGGVPSPKEVLLYLVTRKIRPSSAIETGVAQGVSSVFILEAMTENRSGELTSIDLPNRDPEGKNYLTEPGTHDGTYVKRELEVGWLVPPTLRACWNLRLGASRDVLPTLSPADLDLFYHDSEHSYANMMFEYGWALNHLTPGGVLASDDINWNGSFRDFVAQHAPALTVLSDRKFGLAFANALRDGPPTASVAASNSPPEPVTVRFDLAITGSGSEVGLRRRAPASRHNR